MDKKRIFQILSSIFVAVIFVASYAAFGNNNGSSLQQSTTTILQRTTPGFGTTNAVVYGYGQQMYVTIGCSNSSLKNSTIAEVSNVLSQMLLNGSINIYNNNKTGFSVVTGTGAYNSFIVKSVITSSLSSNASKCTSFSGLLEITSTADCET